MCVKTISVGNYLFSNFFLTPESDVGNRKIRLIILNICVFVMEIRMQDIGFFSLFFARCSKENH